MGDAENTSDADLAAAAAGGDRSAFEVLLRRHYDRIHALAWQLTGSRADADDIAQDVCCILVERISGFRGEAKFTTWLCSIVFNACRDLRRRRRSFGSFTERLAVLAGLVRASDGRDLHEWDQRAGSGATCRWPVTRLAGRIRSRGRRLRQGRRDRPEIGAGLP